MDKTNRDIIELILVASTMSAIGLVSITLIIHKQLRQLCLPRKILYIIPNGLSNTYHFNKLFFNNRQVIGPKIIKNMICRINIWYGTIITGDFTVLCEREQNIGGSHKSSASDVKNADNFTALCERDSHI